jgi:hypothetical protein
MTTNWSMENYDAPTQVKREAERDSSVHPKSLVPMPTPQIDHPLTGWGETESLLNAGYSQWKMWFIGADVMLAGLAGVTIFLFLNIVSFIVLGSAPTVAGIMAAVGLGYFLLRRRVFMRGVMRERQRVQDQAGRLKTSETEHAD